MTNPLKVLTAYNQEPLGELERLDETRVFNLLEQAVFLFKDRKKWLPTYERIGILERAAEIIAKEREELALCAAREGGKPLKDSLVEVDRAVEGVKSAIRELCHLGGSEIPMDLTSSSSSRRAYTKREPRGVVLAISAFNHPFNLIIHQVIPALAAGCPVLVKPALETPLSCRNVVDILYRAGLPKKWCQMILCEVPVISKLAQDKRISFLSFIGSPEVGWSLRSRLAPGVLCALEHGGIAPAIIHSSYPWEKAVPPLVKGGFYHGGQVCVSVQRVMVGDEVLGDFSHTMKEAVESLRVGDPALMETDVGPLIRPQEVERVHSWVEKALRGGAELLCGGKKISQTCYAPTLLLNPPLDTEVSSREIFGPVVCLYGYESLERAIESANSTDYAFQAAIFTSNLDVALYAIDHLEAQAVMVNEHTAFRADWMPFGGYKKSGLGLGGMGCALRDMTLEKMFVIKTPP